MYTLHKIQYAVSFGIKEYVVELLYAYIFPTPYFDNISLKHMLNHKKSGTKSAAMNHKSSNELKMFIRFNKVQKITIAVP